MHRFACAGLHDSREAARISVVAKRGSLGDILLPLCGSGGIGRRARLRILCPKGRVGVQVPPSAPTLDISRFSRFPLVTSWRKPRSPDPSRETSPNNRREHFSERHCCGMKWILGMVICIIIVVGALWAFSRSARAQARVWHWRHGNWTEVGNYKVPVPDRWLVRNTDDPDLIILIDTEAAESHDPVMATNVIDVVFLRRPPKDVESWKASTREMFKRIGLVNVEGDDFEHWRCDNHVSRRRCLPLYIALSRFERYIPQLHQFQPQPQFHLCWAPLRSKRFLGNCIASQHNRKIACEEKPVTRHCRPQHQDVNRAASITLI